jgi:hypothetical protein
MGGEGHIADMISRMKYNLSLKKARKEQHNYPCNYYFDILLCLVEVFLNRRFYIFRSYGES